MSGLAAFGTGEPAGESPAVASERISDHLRFAAFAPSAVRPGSQFVLTIWAFVEAQRREMLGLASSGGGSAAGGKKGPAPIRHRADIAVCVDLPGFDLAVTANVIHWAGEIGNASFPVAVPPAVPPGVHTGRAKVLCAGVSVARLDFPIEVGAREGKPSVLPAEERRVRSVFASYAGEDRPEVLQWQRDAAAIGVDVFTDVLALRDGPDWEKEMWQQIPAQDLFCLFWSLPASRSAWVEKEWRCALATRGLDSIHPVPFADPREVPLPRELGASKHFNDLARIVIAYELSLRPVDPEP